MSAATESRPTDHAPIVVDLSAPGVYEGMLRLAHVIEQHIRAMPLEAMASRALGEMGPRAYEAYTDWRILGVLEDAQRELVKIRARAGG